MKYKSLLFILATILFGLAGNAQVSRGLYTVRAQVLDSVQQTPIELASIILGSRTQTSITSVLTDKEGKFILKEIPAGVYKASVTSGGYHPVTIQLDISDTSGPEIDLGRILMARKVSQLQELTVTAKKPLIRQEIDRIIYSVEDDPDSRIFNLLDMLRKVPLLSVTGEDQLMMKGSSNFKILLDGRSSSLFNSASLKNILKTIPAKNILRIEVITVPPAKYEGEGLTGIINIITDRKLKDGYNASVTAGVSRLISSTSGSLNWKKGRFGMSAYVGHSLETTPASPFFIEAVQAYPGLFTVIQNGETDYQINTTFGNAQMSFEQDSLNMFTLNLGLSRSRNSYENRQYTRLSDDDGRIYQSYGLYIPRTNKDRVSDLEFNYQKGFMRSKAQLLTFSIRHARLEGGLETLNSASDKFNYRIEDIRQNSEAGLKENTIQADYVHPHKKLTIEAGGKFVARSKYSDFWQRDYDPVTNQFKIVEEKSDYFEYRQNIAGFYSSVLLRQKNWAFRTGFRLEATGIDADFLTSGTTVNQHYINLLPSVSFIYRRNASSINAGYSQRVQRPGIALLNPFVDQSDPRFFRSGNPNLLPVLAHNILINYTRIKKHTVTAGMGYSFARNTIQSVYTPGADSVVRINYENIGQYDKLAGNLSLGFNITKQVNLTVNGTVNYVWIRGGAGSTALENRGVEGFIYSYLSYRPGKDWRFSLNGGYYGPTRNLQSNSNSYFYSSLGCTRQFLKQKASVSLSVSNPFQQFRTLRVITERPGFYQEAVTQKYFRNINLSLSYNLGRLKEEIRKNRRGISNDDKAVETGKVQ